MGGGGDAVVCLLTGAPGAFDRRLTVRSNAPQMLRTMTSRQRCTECRGWYHPAPSAKGSQVVCSEACRRARRRKQAQRRRAEQLEESRSSERARQRACRAREQCVPAGSGARAGPGGQAHDVTTCHAPPSTLKSSELREQLALFWDTQAQRSRATLDRELQRIARETRDFVARSLAEIETGQASVTRYPPG